MSRHDDDEPVADDELTQIFSCLEHRSIALAVSGGVDSMVLMHLVARWAANWPDRAEQPPCFDFPPEPRQAPAEPIVGLPAQRPNFAAAPAWLTGVRGSGSGAPAARRPERRIVVLTVDHRLRPESADEARFVAEAAHRLALPHQTLVWVRGHPTASDATETGTAAPVRSGLQARARAARYHLMSDLVDAELWDRFAAGLSPGTPLDGGQAKRAIVTAHHRDDLVETFLMRLKRGSGLDGLSSIRTSEMLRRPPTPDRRYPSEVELLRPLLDIPKSRLIATAKAQGIAWREDPSNRNDHFERVQLRRDAPALSELGFEPKALHLTVRRLQRAREVIEMHTHRRVQSWLGEPGVLDFNAGFFATIQPTGGGAMGGGFSLFADVNQEIMLRLLLHVIRSLGGCEEPPELAQLEDLRRRLLACSAGPPEEVLAKAAGSARTLAGCRIDVHVPRVDGHLARIRIWREAGRAGLPQMELAPGDGGWWDNRFAVSASRGAPGPVTVRALGDDGWLELKRRVPALAAWRSIPPGAAATLPAIWHGSNLVAVPYFDRLPRTVPEWLRREIVHEWEARSGLKGCHYRIEFRPALG